MNRNTPFRVEPVPELESEVGGLICACFGWKGKCDQVHEETGHYTRIGQIAAKPYVTSCVCNSVCARVFASVCQASGSGVLLLRTRSLRVSLFFVSTSAIARCDCKLSQWMRLMRVSMSPPPPALQEPVAARLEPTDTACPATASLPSSMATPTSRGSATISTRARKWSFEANTTSPSQWHQKPSVTL